MMVQASSEAARFEERRKHVMNKYLEGSLMGVIARELGVSISTVSRDITAVRDIWREDMAEEYAILKDRELARLDRVELAAWEGWQRSMRDEVVMTERMQPVGTGDEKAAVGGQVIQTREQAGNPAFLSVLHQCISQRCKILGLNAPTKKDITSSGTSVKYIIGVDPDLV
jgi:hypothetical protein